MTPSGIRTLTVGAVLEIIIDRPARKNAFTNAMYTQLTQQLEAAATLDSIAVVLIRGEGGNFSSGNDLKDFLENPPTDFSAPVFGLMTILITFPKPIICAVEGFAVGIGTTLLLHADIVYAGASAKFQLPFVNLGLVPEAGSSLLLPQVAGTKAANELFMFGEIFDSETAMRHGIINHIIDDGEVLSFTQKRAQILASKPRGAMQEAKTLMKQPAQALLLQQIRIEGDAFVKRLQSPEAVQAMQAFFNRK